ncbi:Gp15 family bacteriophage protein [Salibacterium aidingense]|uniref:Gp15 family bacteriophage protein n=1 Tax=Salibacterium aidingense TaxID=384933 RepID=UPI003BC7F872
MFRLTERFEDVFTYDGHDYRLDLSFDNVLRTQELMKDETFNELERIYILFEMLVTNPPDNLDIYKKGVIVRLIFQTFIYEDNYDNSDDGTTERLLDMEEDADYIYASFLQDYGIDLFGMQGKLHWKQFKALLSGLRDNTKFKQVVSIRSRKVPNPTRYNKEYRDQLIKLKRIYALDQTNITADDIDRKFDRVANMLRPQGR